MIRSLCTRCVYHYRESKAARNDPSCPINAIHKLHKFVAVGGVHFHSIVIWYRIAYARILNVGIWNVFWRKLFRPNKFWRVAHALSPAFRRLDDPTENTTPTKLELTMSGCGTTEAKKEVKRREKGESCCQLVFDIHFVDELSAKARRRATD